MSNRDREPTDTWRDPAEANAGAQDQTSRVEHGYGQGGKTAYGQMIDGGSDMPGRGFGGSNAGGFGQQTQNSQWGQGGMGPMTQGANYSQGGGQFSGPIGYQPLPESFRQDAHGQYRQPGSSQAPYKPLTSQAGGSDRSSGQFYTGATGQDGYGQSSSAQHHDPHEPHYRTWRENQLASHDRDYARWRDEQTRKYDEDYSGWRNERHATFSKEFEGWRFGRGGQAGSSAPTESAQGRSASAGTAATDAASETSVYGLKDRTGTAGSTSTSNASVGANYANSGDDDRQKVDANAVHGANPTLAAIADGGSESHRDRPSGEDRRKEEQTA